VEADVVMVAVGRRFNTVDVGLEQAGVEVDDGRLVADESGRTAAEGVWAAGDVLGGRWLLAHVASRQAINCVEDALAEEPVNAAGVIPYGIFTIPEVGGAGMTEAEAREAGYEVTVGTFPFMALGRAVCADETDGFVKVVAEARSRKVLGMHILGVRAADLVHEGALAMERGATLDSLTETIHSHPTFAEAVHEAALGALGIALHLPREQS
jgi:dihydrolipoamide dehydrogenase